MLPASNRGMGMSLNFPDVCKTPAPPAPFIPVPYPDLGMNMQAAPFSPFVFIAFMPATNMGTLKVMTSGDEAGAMGGLVTGMIKGPGKTTVGNPIVFVTGLPAESLLNPTSGNMMNAPVGAQIVPSVVNVLYTYAVDRGAFESGAVDRGTGAWTTLGDGEVRALAELARGEGGVCEAAHVTCSSLAPGVALLRIGLFGSHTDREVFNALRAHGEAHAVVVDLRANPGGDADAALRLAGACLPAGTPLLLRIDADGDEEEVVARGRVTHEARWIVLVDGGTASAAELFAAALQHAGRALVVGAPTYGKASGQQVIAGPDGDARYATTTLFALPDGTPIEGRGVTPDVLAPAASSTEDGDDPPLRAALAIATGG